MLAVLFVFLVVGLARPADAATDRGEITRMRLSHIGDQSCSQAPVTFGLPFSAGALAAGTAISARLNGQELPTQTDIKARNADGSARHAVITIDAPCDDGAMISLVAADAASQGSEISLSDVLDSDFDARANLQLNGQQWHVDARSLLARVDSSGRCNAGEFYCKRWLAGPLVSEWVVGAPLEDANGNPHPHLAAYFAVRAYGPAPVQSVRVDTVIENAWAFADNPSNYKYSASIELAGKNTPVYTVDDLTHYARARWHQVSWWGDGAQAQLYAQPDSQYLQSTLALPSYAKGRLSPKTIRKARQSCAPMKHCGQTARMANTGAQSAIGPLPRWSAAYVIQPEYRVYRWMLANTDALGAYSFHFRERQTGLPLSVARHPCQTLVWPARAKTCPKPTADDSKAPYKPRYTPGCDKTCETPLAWDVAHHPAPAYVAYLATGDWYYANEMTFMASWVAMWQNPKYRSYDDVLVYRTQVRGQAWMLRTLGYAAYLLPDDDDQKQFFNQVVENNIEWYNKKFTHNPDAMPLGALTAGGAVVYNMHGEKRVGIASWQQSFFTWAVGNLADLGFEGADELRDWVSRFQIGLMTSPDYCWELASAYKIQLRDERKAPLYQSFDEVFSRSFPRLADMSCDPKRINNAIRKYKISSNFDYPPGTMVGYPASATGFPANFQIGLAAAANAAVPNAAEAWNKFARRDLQPSFSSSPQFAIVPSGVSTK